MRRDPGGGRVDRPQPVVLLACVQQTHTVGDVIDRPVLLLDVDGCLSVFTSPDSSSFTQAQEAAGPDGGTYVLNVRPEMSAWLAELAEHYELVWCTTWSNANTAIAPLLGLAGLDQVPFPEKWEDVPLDLCRKTEYVRLWAAGRDPMPDRNLSRGLRPAGVRRLWVLSVRAPVRVC